MGAQPWLDSLSDDWEVSSASPVSAPEASKIPDERARSAASRIPRYVSPQKGMLPEPKRRASSNNASSKEQKDFVVHIKQHEGDSAILAWSGEKTQPSATATMCSAASVVKHEAVAKPEQSGEHGVAKDQRVAELQQIVMQQQDLFSPTGLEGIFKQPQRKDDSSPNKQSFSFYNDLTHMPSSPPSWHPISERSSSNAERGGEPALTILSAKQDDKDRPNAPHTVASSRTEVPSPQSVLEKDSQLSRSLSAPSSSVTGGFSPVFISKHNTVDGRVNYAAFDPGALPRLSEHVNVERGGHSESDSFKTRPLSPSVSSSALKSDSLAPSDSISQVRVDTSGPNAQRKITSLCNEVTLEDKQEVCRQVSNTSQSDSAQTVVERPSSPIAELASPKPTSSLQHQQDASDRRHIKSSGNGRSTASTSNATSKSIPGQEESAQRPTSVAGRKRKDARYDTNQACSDASAVALREILRPRNPTPWQGKEHYHRSTSKGLEELLDSSAIGEAEVPDLGSKRLRKPQRTVRARALALEAATFGERQTTGSGLEIRKKSVSTQDYLNEAMRIMDLIRARKQATTSEWSSNSGLGSEKVSIHDAEQEQTMQSLSRPPSRDGPPSAWRTQRPSNHINPQVESQLRKYEETGDESFLVSSIVRSVRITAQDKFHHEQDGLRIIDNPQRDIARRSSDPGPPDTVAELRDATMTNSCDEAIYDSAETQKSSSTQKMSSIGRIAPETVSHLIRDEEAGMRFDTKKQTWVKCKLQRQCSSSTKVPTSSSATEDDPLGEIPDLSVCGPSVVAFPRRRESKPAEVKNDAAAHDDTAHESDNDPQEPSSKRQFDREAIMLHQPGLNDAKSILQPENSTILSNDASGENEISSEADQSLQVEDAEIPLKSIEAGGEVVDDDDEEEDALASLPRPKQKARRREQSVLFSSPPVSREWEAKHWTDSSDPNNALGVEDDTLDPDSSQMARIKTRGQTRGSPRSTENPRWSRNVSMLRSDQHQEISFVEQRPDGRTFSLSMSVSTPLQTRRRSNTRLLSSSGLRNCSFLDSLSPLSDFSILNDDDQHLRNNALSRPVEIVQRGRRTSAHAALATNDLVEKLTNAEPDEPYWDFMHRLSLADQRLDTLNMLDEFCPRLEELNASNNQLHHLTGVPTSLRLLDLSRNQLTSLTDLSHLHNLQCLRLAQNGLSKVSGFGCLVHLRDLDLEHNQIDDLDDILDLDGLMTVNLRHNKLSNVDFASAQLRSLTTMDLSNNDLISIEGLSALTALEKIDLSGNKISGLSANNSHLRVLSANNNHLTHLDIDNWPSIETLSVDSNSITTVANISTHTKLQTLHLRNQKVSLGQSLTTLDSFLNLTHLHLSGTSLGPLLPLTVPFLNLRTLDVSFSGIQALPSDFGTIVPNLRTLNLNANGIKDLRPLEGIVGLRHLYVAQNRISRLRNFVKVLSRLGGLVKGGGVLEEVDARGNPLTLGFYGNFDGSLRLSKGKVQETEAAEEDDLCHLVPKQQIVTDQLHLERLDSDTRMKRRVYEMLVGSKCPRLTTLDGLVFEREATQRRDNVWEALVEMGVVRRVE